MTTEVDPKHLAHLDEVERGLGQRLPDDMREEAEEYLQERKKIAEPGNPEIATRVSKLQTPP